MVDSSFPLPDQVSFTDMPDFSFDLQVLGGDITLLPGLEAWLNAFVRHSLLRSAPCSLYPYRISSSLLCPLC